VKIGVIAGRVGVRDGVSLASTLGAAGIAMAASEELGALSDSGAREVRHLFSREAITLIGLTLDLGATGLTPKADLQQQVDRVERAIVAATRLGSRLVLVEIGPLPPSDLAPPPPPAIEPGLLGKLILPDAPKPPPPPTVQRDTAFESTLQQGLTAFCDRANRHGTTVALRSSLGSVVSLASFLRNIACPWLGIDLDPLHVLAEGSSLESALSSCADLIRHARLRDGQRGQGNRSRAVPLGEGQIDVSDYVSLLREADYDGFLSIDPSELAEPRLHASRAIDALKRIL
jgi:L-ribulose-5-phosphate 3-epimerase